MDKKTGVLAGLGLAGAIIALAFNILCIIVAWIIGTFIAGYFHFHGVLWWVCSIMFTLIILGFYVRISRSD